MFTKNVVNVMEKEDLIKQLVNIVMVQEPLLKNKEVYLVLL